MMGGTRVPLASVVSVDRVTGAAAVIPGGRVLVGDSPADGFGLGGYPGAGRCITPVAVRRALGWMQTRP